VKIWFNKIHDSRRAMIEVAEGAEVSIGRDAGNTLILKSPLVSKRQAIVSRDNGQLRLTNVGINSCMVGEAEVLGGETRDFSLGETVRIWPYTLNFELDEAAPISRQQLDAHLRSLMSDLASRVHRKLLERFDLYELEHNQLGNQDSILLLERHIEDVCREMRLFAEQNDPLLDELIGLTLRDYVINQLILESDDERFRTNHLTWNEFDVPATLVPERETELQNLLISGALKLAVAGPQRQDSPAHFPKSFHSSAAPAQGCDATDPQTSRKTSRTPSGSARYRIYFGDDHEIMVVRATRFTSNATACWNFRAGASFPTRSPSRSSNGSSPRSAGGSTRASRSSMRGSATAAA
jgi:hypothetical protein